jgi:hypothetical protein
MTAFSSLTNRIFVAASILAVLSIVVAIYIVNRAVSAQADAELQRGIAEAATLVDEYRNFDFESFGRAARFIADIPQLKAAVDTHDPATVEPLAREYQSQFPNADLFAIADDRGKVRVRLGAADVPETRWRPSGKRSGLVAAASCWSNPCRSSSIGVNRICSGRSFSGPCSTSGRRSVSRR